MALYSFIILVRVFVNFFRLRIVFKSWLGGGICCSDYELLHKVNIWYDNRIGVSGVSQPLASINGGEMCSTDGHLDVVQMEAVSSFCSLVLLVLVSLVVYGLYFMIQLKKVSHQMLLFIYRGSHWFEGSLYIVHCALANI